MATTTVDSYREAGAAQARQKRAPRTSREVRTPGPGASTGKDGEQAAGCQIGDGWQHVLQGGQPVYARQVQ